MNKRILGGLAVAAMLAGGLAITSAGVASAASVHHPVCAAGSTLVKDQAPYSGFGVTIPAGYSDVTMYLKISNQHVEVPVVSSGQVYGPSDLSSWPRNGNGQPQEISHVDYCVPDVVPGAPTTITVSWLLGPSFSDGSKRPPTGKSIFPQDRLSGIDAAPCSGRWVQTDVCGLKNGNKGPLSAQVAALGDTLTWEKGKPEDSHLYISHVFTHSGNCPTIPDPAKLRLTFMQECGTFTPLEGPWNAPKTVQFCLHNSNAVPVAYVLRQDKADIVQRGNLPVGDTLVDFPFGLRTLILETYNAAGKKVHEATKAGGNTYLTTTEPDEQYPDGKCRPTTPDRTVPGAWQDGTPECGDTRVDQTRVVTMTTYKWNGQGFVGTETTETGTRSLELDEIVPCPTTPPPTVVVEQLSPPASTPPVIVEQLPPPVVVEQLPPPVVVEQLPPPVVVEQLPPPVVVEQLPPTTPSGVTQATREVVASFTPAQAPTTTAPAPVATIAVAGLPATGSDGIGVTALIALLVTSLGGAALLAARRRNVTI